MYENLPWLSSESIKFHASNSQTAPNACFAMLLIIATDNFASQEMLSVRLITSVYTKRQRAVNWMIDYACR